MTRSSIQLVSGSCTGERTKQVVLNSSTPYYADTLPLLSQWLSRYSPTNSQSQSPWLVPSLTTSVASMFWARIIYVNPTNNTFPEIYYTPTEEIIWSTRSTLQASWGLYLTLSIHPILCTAMLLSICFCYQTPIGTGFGLISVLASIRRDNLDQLAGAGFSGTLMRKVPLKIDVQNSHSHPRIWCHLGGNLKTKGQLHMKEKYY